MRYQRYPTILLVEDDPAHAMLVERTLKKGGFENEVVTLTDGQQALDYLFVGDESADRPPSSALFMLLDLNLPRFSGFQVLERVKSDARTRRIPIVVFTTTDNPREVERCYDLGCNAYVTKPVEYDRFRDAVRAIGEFLTVTTVPDGAGA